MSGRFISLVLALGLLAGCERSGSSGAPTPGPTGPQAVLTPMETDPQMAAAMKQARESLPDFIAAIQRKSTAGTYFSLQAKFIDGSKAESIWLKNVTHDGANFHGQIGIKPLEVTTVALDQQVTVAPSDIQDWMVIEKGKLIGGYTVRVMRSRMNAEERKDFDLIWGITAE